MTVTLQAMKDVVSTHSVEALIQWLYLRVAKFDIKDYAKYISAAIELARLADNTFDKSLSGALSQRSWVRITPSTLETSTLPQQPFFRFAILYAVSSFRPALRIFLQRDAPISSMALKVLLALDLTSSKR
ncbi:hypothetical protein N7466_010140 [Penicillium verhagenii]|uniref:uncharacterized protein n=1 Tax=Penicillium verhagenii TaxID=1562060 RepID=UPI002544F314|nr:uncharacterized protein N7466_010140 [Penicillium verhagenii]KAJ5919197.1 hypothetical protein N7466_010140 [Penicillium verhagenii]